MLTHGTLQTQFSEDDVTESWLLISGEDLRKIFGKRRQGFGNGRQGKRKKRGEGWVGEGKRKKRGEGWVKARGKKRGGVGGGRQENIREGRVGDDVIKK